MNTALLPALGLVLGLVLVVGLGVLLLRRGRRAAPPVVPAPPQRPATTAAPAAPAPAAAAAELDVRRQANAEALRLARQRKADEAARLEAERAAQARAEAAARRAAPTAPTAPTAPRPPAGWASRPMGLDPVEPVAPRQAPVQQAAPADTVAPRNVRPFAPTQPLPPQPQPPRPAAPPRTPVVLVADDSKVVRVKTGRLLEKQGWQVLLADDGAAALRLLDSQVPDLLITDVEMPGLDGFALTRQIRGHARCARLPVIMITSSDERHRDEAQAAGVDLLLGKPYAEETLVAQAQRLLGVTAPALH